MTGIERQYTVAGMTCAHCVAAVTEEVQRVEGVEQVAVELDGGRLDVAGAGFDDASIREAVEEAGYEVVSASP